LPLSDDDILFLGPSGPLYPSNAPDEFHWTADRVSLPNKLILGDVPEDTNNYSIFIQNY
jgi:hypothetical protein